MSRANKAVRSLLAIIAEEGATVLDTQQMKNHMRVSYTFDEHHSFTQTLPRHGTLSDRWEKNFRAAIRRNNPTRK